MQGFQITFFTQRDRAHNGEPMAQWLFEQAKTLGIKGATLDGSFEGFGRDGVSHAVTLFDLSDQPVQVTLVTSPEEADRLFAHLAANRAQVFYVKTAVEYGVAGALS